VSIQIEFNIKHRQLSALEGITATNEKQFCVFYQTIDRIFSMLQQSDDEHHQVELGRLETMLEDKQCAEDNFVPYAHFINKTLSIVEPAWNEHLDPAYIHPLAKRLAGFLLLRDNYTTEKDIAQARELPSFFLLANDLILFADDFRSVTEIIHRCILACESTGAQYKTDY
jgi:hypothetical protein